MPGNDWRRSKADSAASASGRVATRRAPRRPQPRGRAARFNYGSTVIVLLPQGAATLDPALHAESPVRLGQRLALRE